MVAELLASRNGIEISKAKSKSLTGKGNIAHTSVLIAKPQTFMNLSGEAVRPLFSYFGIGIEDVIIIHDDLDLDFGRIKIKSGGGHGGHNGTRSIMSHLGDDGFTRVRMGIGKAPAGWDVSKYVLTSFSPDEQKELKGLIERSADAVEKIINEGLLQAMNEFN